MARILERRRSESSRPNQERRLCQGAQFFLAEGGGLAGDAFFGAAFFHMLAFTRKRGSLDRTADGARESAAPASGSALRLHLSRGGALLSRSASVALPLYADDIGVVDDAVDERGGARAIGKDASPFREGQI